MPGFVRKLLSQSSPCGRTRVGRKQDLCKRYEFARTVKNIHTTLMRLLPSMQTLRALEAAARLESYSGAAQELDVTHGAISHRIRKLELQLGATLFIGRHGRW